MKNIFSIILFLIITSIACDKHQNNLKVSATVIGFTPEKCYCCWGWVIKLNQDTIKTDNIPALDTIVHTLPIQVVLELGEKYRDCSSISSSYKYDYYRITSLYVK